MAKKKAAKKAAVAAPLRVNYSNRRLNIQYTDGSTVTMPLSSIDRQLQPHLLPDYAEIINDKLRIPFKTGHIEVDITPSNGNTDLEQFIKNYKKVNKILNNLPGWLDKELKKRNMTYIQLAEKTGIFNSQLYRWKNEGVKPTIDSFVQILQALRIDFNKL